MINSILQAIRQRYSKQQIVMPMAVLLAAGLSSGLQAQEAADVEKISVVGSQIKGAEISEALAMSVLEGEVIEGLGIDSGDELLNLIPENGQNFFNEAGNISGGVNAARGDIGAFNLRNLGTGNTLALLNGRRMVNAASYQTEEVGGSFVPVNTVNTQTLPLYGVRRVEVLRDGASAIYGADAVAGVINTVTRNDYEGFNIRVKWKEFEHLPRDDQTLSLQWGDYFNDGRTNIGLVANYYQRDRVNSQDDPRWSNSDLRDRIPEDSLWFDDIRFRNDSANSLFGQFDVVPRLGSDHSLRENGVVDNAGEFETYPIGDPRCQYAISDQLCGAEDGQGVIRYNLNENRDLVSELERMNVFMNINHVFDNGTEAFTELMAYQSRTNLRRHPTASFSTSELVVGAGNYYNPFGPCGSPNRLPDELIGADVPCEGLPVVLDNYRFAEVPRVVDNDGDTYRILQGLRGQWGNWDWESAVSWSRATKDDVTHNRVSNTLMREALNDTTSAAYNPFSGGENSNIERAQVSVTRLSETELTTFDVKFSNADIYQLPAGPVGFVAGLEYREESFKDDRDPRLDGTIQFTDEEGDTYPFVSDVVNSSPTPDSSGERDVASLFAELQVPVLSNLDLQLALRYEDFSDVGDTTVGKLAFGWRPLDNLLFRGSWSEAFRAPNLVTINEEIIARQATRTDYVCQYAAENGGDPDQEILSCRNSIQRIAQGSDQLQPEKSDNISVGFVFEPLDGLALTFDYWSIEKKNTIGLLGEENHTLLDLLSRLEQGDTNCSGSSFNQAVSRGEIDPAVVPIYQAAGICPAGDIQFVDDSYANLDTRTVKGYDIGVYYDLDTDVGRFRFDFNGSYLDKFEQVAGGDAARLVDAQSQGVIPESFPVTGFADLIGQDGNQKQKHSMRLSWRHGDFGATLAGYKIGSFYQSGLTLDDGTRYVIPSMTTYDTTFDYYTEVVDTSVRFRLGVKNITDERAPLADSSFGYFEDAHQDYGRYFYLDMKATL
ncbi:TonB-dependent receptor domain-containing protein [Lacimicrobium alkaliphilum]|uniref:TonB-dependent receptor n=1 Tax=Lacimicrobium alkaliphilum TaxID=1526571 RepID=A0A0U3AXQ4_9ALTE|nr:TonB-dependent receptor [Lacimicrobium alkaliphilum]ALS98911.1 TonB-dependent receptor [Lacimicrobium alkaliphilum]